MADMYLITEADGRLATTADRRRLVPDDDPEARLLYTIPGRRIPMADAVRYGLVSVEEPTSTPVEVSSDQVEDAPVTDEPVQQAAEEQGADNQTGLADQPTEPADVEPAVEPSKPRRRKGKR